MPVSHQRDGHFFIKNRRDTRVKKHLTNLISIIIVLAAGSCVLGFLAHISIKQHAENTKDWQTQSFETQYDNVKAVITVDYDTVAPVLDFDNGQNGNAPFSVESRQDKDEKTVTYKVICPKKGMYSFKYDSHANDKLSFKTAYYPAYTPDIWTASLEKKDAKTLTMNVQTAKSNTNQKGVYSITVTNNKHSTVLQTEETEFTTGAAILYDMDMTSFKADETYAIAITITEGKTTTVTQLGTTTGDMSTIKTDIKQKGGTKS